MWLISILESTTFGNRYSQGSGTTLKLTGFNTKTIKNLFTQ